MTHLEIALKEYGTHEIIGGENNPRILQYFKDIGQKWVTSDETAWCAAFINWCLKQAGKIGTGALNARSFQKYGTPTLRPELGDIVILWRISKDGPFGHVGFYINETEHLIYILSGNQGNSVNISAFPKEQLLEYRKLPL